MKLFVKIKKYQFEKTIKIRIQLPFPTSSIFCSAFFLIFNYLFDQYLKWENVMITKNREYLNEYNKN